MVLVTGIIVVCIVCVGFVSLLIVLGIMRIRNTQRHSRDVNVDEKQEMEWDNSALTITVNPMDQEVCYVPKAIKMPYWFTQSI